jgi:hypothetical protein
MISQSTLLALCEEAGVDPHYCASVEINPKEAVFTMHSQDMRGNRYLMRDKETIQTYWVKAKVNHD